MTNKVIITICFINAITDSNFANCRNDWRLAVALFNGKEGNKWVKRVIIIILSSFINKFPLVHKHCRLPIDESLTVIIVVYNCLAKEATHFLINFLIFPPLIFLLPFIKTIFISLFYQVRLFVYRGFYNKKNRCTHTDTTSRTFNEHVHF